MSTEHFRRVAPVYMSKLMTDFGCTLDDAAAVFGNLGHESGGLVSLQEISPTVKGSRGGYGWPQWTGPRRREYEDYCRRNGLDPAADASNYAWLFLDLKGPYAKAMAAVKAAPDLYGKVKAFEVAYERAGVKNYPSRLNWAVIARTAWHAAHKPSTVPPDSAWQPEPDVPAVPPPPDVEPPQDDAHVARVVSVTETVIAILVIIALAGIVAFFTAR